MNHFTRKLRYIQGMDTIFAILGWLGKSGSLVAYIVFISKRDKLLLEGWAGDVRDEANKKNAKGQRGEGK